MHWVVLAVRGQKGVEDRLHDFKQAEDRLRSVFTERGIAYPPARLILLGLKFERRVEVYAGDTQGTPRWVMNYPILAASGGLGPKLREGDRQVPEGVYGVDSLNPNSRYHAALRIDYPNVFDRASARPDDRTRLGGDIMIHGGGASVGCLAMGDPAAEELFVLAARVGVRNVKVVLTPVDVRTKSMPAELAGLHSERYAAVRAALLELSRP
ncbi:MAG TPA: L,D-transpeptidase family protein [Tepidisphaeraceae bacterium]|jgi:murein L,D-transpeptidase YafK